jgi:hypothetical protein
MLKTSLLACLCALAAAAPASAASPKIEARQYAFDVTGIQVIDWQYRSESCGTEHAPCDEGAGTQTVGWSTPRPVIVDAMVARGRFPAGVRVDSFRLLGQRNAPKIRATVNREGKATHQDPPPACEGSAHTPDCLFVPLPATVASECGRRTLDGLTLSLTQPEHDASILDVGTSEPFARNYTDCAPDSGAFNVVYQLGYSLDMRFEGVAGRLKRMKRGQKVKLHSEDRVDCPMPTAVKGFARCVTTDVTVEVKRRR